MLIKRDRKFFAIAPGNFNPTDAIILAPRGQFPFI
jgi:hypothetical protein